MRKSLFVQLIVLGVVIGGLSALVAIFIPWLPELGSEEGKRIDDLYWLTVVICLVIFAIVAAVSIYAVVKFQGEAGRRRGREADPRPHRARDRLDGWSPPPSSR